MKWKHAKDSWRQTAAGSGGKATLLEGTVPRPRLRSGSGPGERPGIWQTRRTSGKGGGGKLTFIFFLTKPALTQIIERTGSLSERQ